MINRQAMRGAGTKTTTKAPARTKLNKEAGGRASVKANGKAAAATGASRAGGQTRAKPRTKPATTAARSSATRRGLGGRDGARKGAMWRGEEVSSSSRATSAEDAAVLAEGNGPVRAEAAVRDPDRGTYLEKGPARRPRANDPDAAENAEEKRQSAVEDHAARSSRHPPYGRL